MGAGQNADDYFFPLTWHRLRGAPMVTQITVNYNPVAQAPLLVQTLADLR